MMVTLKKFLKDKIIIPLESIAAANKEIQKDYTRADKIDLSDDGKVSKSEMKDYLHMRFSEERNNPLDFHKNQDEFTKKKTETGLKELGIKPASGNKTHNISKTATPITPDLMSMAPLG